MHTDTTHETVGIISETAWLIGHPQTSTNVELTGARWRCKRQRVRTSRFLANFVRACARARRPRTTAWILVALSCSRACVSSRRSYRRSAAYTRCRGVPLGAPSTSATALLAEKSSPPNEGDWMEDRATINSPADRSPASRWWKECWSCASSCSKACSRSPVKLVQNSNSELICTHGASGRAFPSRELCLDGTHTTSMALLRVTITLAVVDRALRLQPAPRRRHVVP